VQPAASHFFIRPRVDKVWAIPQDTVIVIAHDRETENIDCEVLREKYHPFLNLFFSKRVVFPGMLIDPTKKLATTTALLNVIDPD
jgi:hypothetical protein